eukprot:Skav209878  [mRNA]  locus=scaffold3263:18558:19177:- [translate_table: standard]
MSSHLGHLIQLIYGWAIAWMNLQQRSNYVGQVLAVVRRDSRVLPADHFAIQSLHIFGSEGRSQSHHLIEDATQ